MSVSSVLNESGRDLARLAYEISPIIFQDGIATKMGGLAPILLFTEEPDFLNGLIAGGVEGEVSVPSLDMLWCHWKQAPSTTEAPNFLINNVLADKPLSALSAAGNSMNNFISKLSMHMMCPARRAGGLVTKMMTFTALQRTFMQHYSLGGRYIIMTPGYVWMDMILSRVSDITLDQARTPASLFQFEFWRPITGIRDSRMIAENLKRKYASKTGSVALGATGGGNLAETLLSHLGIL